VDLSVIGLLGIRSLAFHDGPPDVLASAQRLLSSSSIVAGPSRSRNLPRWDAGTGGQGCPERLFLRHARQRHAAVQELKAKGLDIKSIMRELRLAKETVRKYYRVASVDDVLANARDGRGSILEPHKPYLHERVNAGITNGSRLFPEIRERGYPQRGDRPGQPAATGYR
jgi:hypothetical protein